MDDASTKLWPAIRRLAFQSLVATIALGSPPLALAADPTVAVERAVNYLAAEVPKWHRENGCYSCHNNGDAVRALAAATRRGLLRDRTPLDDTLKFIRSPEAWDANGPDGPFKDEKLARIQFAAALADATTGGLANDRAALQTAGKLLAELQQSDGSWPSDAEGTVGSPVTYGQPLATALSLRTLRAADAERFARQIELGERWFTAREPRSVLDAAATLLALSSIDTEVSSLRRSEALKLISAGESDGGGWGPFVNSPPEVFDTAVVLLALHAERAKYPDKRRLAAKITQGRNYLLSRQNVDGSWPATTRAPGVDSYAQQVSTTGWAAQALLDTADTVPKSPSSSMTAECK